MSEWEKIRNRYAQKPIQLGLDRVRQVWRALGGKRPPLAISVAGTNGKGSCCFLMDAILRSAGYRVGLYTSPHLLSFHERIRLDGIMVSDEILDEAFPRVAESPGADALTQFELDTLVALTLMDESAVDVGILEVGLGGRLDAVNVIDADAALIAGIDIDHRDWLGETRDAIALEKAGILRPGRPAVCGDPEPPAALLSYAEENAIGLACLGRDFGYSGGEHSWEWHSGKHRLEKLPFPALPGQHQLMNASAVLSLLFGLDGRLEIQESAIREGLASVRLEGRCQTLAGPVPVLLDVAHNPQAARILADHLRRSYPDRRIHAVFAVMRDKDIAGIVANIRDRVHRWYLAPLKIPRAAAPEQLSEMFRALDVTPVEQGFSDAAEAFACARRNAQNGDLVLVFGSFFLVSEYLAHPPEPRFLPNG